VFEIDDTLRGRPVTKEKMMLTLNRTLRVAALLVLALSATRTVARAGDDDPNPAAGDPAPAIEEQLRKQGAMLEQMHELLLKQQAEIDRLRTELDAVRNVAASAPASAPAPGGDATTVSATASAAPAAGDVAQDKPDDALAKKVEALDKMWGNIRLSGDLRFRYEGFYNQGFDALADARSRTRFRARARAQLAGKIDNHFDWAIRLASGSFDDPVSTNQTLGDFYDRKPIAIDRAFLHFTSDSKPVNFDVYAGKFDFTWKKTPLTFDGDLQVEGLSERVRFSLGDDTPLRAVTVTAWQLPMKERSVGADAFIFGGQVLTDWTWSKNWSSSLSGAFHDFEQVDLIPIFTGVSPTLVNAGLEFGTTNTVAVNPFTGLPEYRSEFRAIDLIGDVTYKGIERWPITVVAEWLHNTSAFNNQRDGGYASLQVGQRRERDDIYFDYNFYKAEREVFPSVFMESDVTIQTNSVTHWLTGAYMVRKNVELRSQYYFTRRLQTTSPVNRWLNRWQLDMIYNF
jgi:hypothetical protein